MSIEMIVPLEVGIACRDLPAPQIGRGLAVVAGHGLPQ